jgi:nitrite reductase (NO-forming)
MNRRTLFVSLATVALAVSAVACTQEPEDAMAGPDTDSRPLAPAPAGAPAGPVAAAGGTSGTPIDAVQELTIVTQDSMRFEPSSLTVVAGRPVRLTVRNGGTTEHDFTLSGGVARPVKIAAKPGQTTSATFTVARPGSYQFVCSVFGHALAGMQGTMTATAA